MSSPDKDPADTAGVGWKGRSLPAQPFAADDGRPDPALAQALDGYAGDAVAAARVVAALAPARVLVPVVAVIGQDHPLPDHTRGDLGAEMAMVTLTGADGRRALPVFSCLRSLAAWDAGARPVPVASVRAALSAVSEGCELMVLDPAGPVTFVVPRPAVWALGQGRSWAPPGSDPELAEAVVRAVGADPDVLAVRCEAIGLTGVRIVLGVRAGLAQQQLNALVGAARSHVERLALLAERAESVELKVLPA